MKKFIVLVAFVSASLSMSANAGFISGNHTLTNGKKVALQGLEWMPLTYTAGLSRLDVEDGFTDRFGGVWASDNWRYATRLETENLLGSLWDKAYSGWSETNFLGAQWFLGYFGGLGFDSGYGPSREDKSYTWTSWTNLDYSEFYFGSSNECPNNWSGSCLGHVSAALSSMYDLGGVNVLTGNTEITYKANRNSGVAWFHEHNGINAGMDSTNSTVEPWLKSISLGSLLVREEVRVNPTPVSTPTVISCIALGLFGILTGRRKRRLR